MMGFFDESNNTKAEKELSFTQEELDQIESLGDPKYDPDTGEPENAAAEKAEEIYQNKLDKFDAPDVPEIGGLIKGGSTDVLRGTQISAPRPPSVSPRGGRIGVTYPYKSIAEGSYQQGVAYDDLVDKLVKGLLSEQIRQLPYRGLI